MRRRALNKRVTREKFLFLEKATGPRGKVKKKRLLRTEKPNKSSLFPHREG